MEERKICDAAGEHCRHLDCIQSVPHICNDTCEEPICFYTNKPAKCHTVKSEEETKQHG